MTASPPHSPPSTPPAPSVTSRPATSSRDRDNRNTTTRPHASAPTRASPGSAPPDPRHQHDLVICEGIPDALTAAQAGYRAVATLGTHAADPHVARTLAEHANAHGLILTAVVDADPPGRAAGQRLATLLAAHSVTLRIVEPANGLDLNGWAQRDPSWPSALAPANPTVSRPRALVRHELLTALRFRAAHTARPAPTDRHGPMMIADNERHISRLEAELDQLDDHPPAHTTHPTVSPDPGIEI